MIEENEINTILDKVATLVSLSRILESTYNTNDDIQMSDLWALVAIIKDSSQELYDYTKNLQRT